MLQRLFTAILMLSCLTMLPLSAAAHELERSHIFLTIGDRSIDGRFEINIDDLNKVFGLDLRTDHSVTRAEAEPHAERVYNYFRERSRFAPEGQAREAKISGFQLIDTPVAQYLAVNFSLGAFEQTPAFIDVAYRGVFDVLPDHRGLLVIENDWKSTTFNNEKVISLVFSPDNTEQQLDLSSSTTLSGFIGMIKLGVHHIWEGIDHLLFLFALLLPSVVRREPDGWKASPDFRSSLIHVIKIVTVFTIAHSITLSLAALGTIELSSRIVESIIALSIAIAALDILFPVFRSRIWLIVFAFGLFHGFGFASVLGSIGIPSEYLVHSLLGFNIGVELGQIAVVAVVFPLLYLIRAAWFYPRLVLRFGSLGLIAIAMYWFVERAFEVDLPAGEWMNRMLAVVA